MVKARPIWRVPMTPIAVPPSRDALSIAARRKCLVVAKGRCIRHSTVTFLARLRRCSTFLRPARQRDRRASESVALGVKNSFDFRCIFESERLIAAARPCAFQGGKMEAIAATDHSYCAFCRDKMGLTSVSVTVLKS